MHPDQRSDRHGSRCRDRRSDRTEDGDQDNVQHEVERARRARPCQKAAVEVARDELIADWKANRVPRHGDAEQDERFTHPLELRAEQSAQERLPRHLGDAETGEAVTRERAWEGAEL
jgi:hypothetical protein